MMMAKHKPLVKKQGVCYAQIYDKNKCLNSAPRKID